MGALGDMVGNVADAAMGTKRGTTLESFLSKFSSAEGVMVNTIDPLHTFDVEFKFYPSLTEKAPSVAEPFTKDWFKNIGDAALDSASNMASNALNNMTGGLLGSIVNGQKSISSQRSSFGAVGKQSFLEYLAEANLLTNKDNYMQQGVNMLKGDKSSGGSTTSPLVLQLGYYVQSITVPQLKMDDGGMSETLVGKFPINGQNINPDSNTLILSIINTKVPLLERIFYPWAREVTMPWWSYEVCPYTTATVTIDMTKHSDIRYVFYGCRPSVIQTEQPTQEVDTTITRDVTLLFDFMLVHSQDNICEDWKSKLMSTASSLASSAGGMIGL